MTSSLVRTLIVASLAVACSKSGGSGPKPPPPAPNGAPVVFEVVKLTPGAKFDGKLDVKAYNFSDKTIAGYTVAARYTDAGGARLKVGVGTPFEKDVAWTSMSGRSLACKPKSWCELEIEALEVPDQAVKAEVALTSARALAADGMKFEEPDLWKSASGMGEWPADLP